jgi:hypothetical protein
MDFPSIYTRLSRGGDPQSDAFALDGQDGDADVLANDNLLTEFAREQEQSCPSALNAAGVLSCDRQTASRVKALPSVCLYDMAMSLSDHEV